MAITKGYTKLDSNILTSSIWQSDLHVKVMWITMLALSDKDGEVAGSVPGLANLAGVTIAQAEEALALFLAPDPYSRSEEHEGRRIEKIAGGWFILNRAKYRDDSEKRASRRRDYQRDLMRKRRAEEADKNAVSSVDSVSTCEQANIANKANVSKNVSTDKERDRDNNYNCKEYQKVNVHREASAGVTDSFSSRFPQNFYEELVAVWNETVSVKQRVSPSEMARDEDAICLMIRSRNILPERAKQAIRNYGKALKQPDSLAGKNFRFAYFLRNKVEEHYDPAFFVEENFQRRKDDGGKPKPKTEEQIRAEIRAMRTSTTSEIGQ